MSDLLESIPPLVPSHFFALEVEIGKKGTRLPDMSDFLAEISFADVTLTFKESGVLVEIDVKHPFDAAFYPDFKKGSAVELFFDTRDVKSAALPSKFCHHFLFLPEAIQGVQAQEVTAFRAEEARPLAETSHLRVKTQFSSRSFTMEVQIDKEALYGYDFSTFRRCGFTYCIHRTGGGPQHFALPSEHLSLEKHPALWASLKW